MGAIGGELIICPGYEKYKECRTAATPFEYTFLPSPAWRSSSPVLACLIIIFILKVKLQA